MKQARGTATVSTDWAQVRRTGQADTEVGSRIRRARMNAKMSQEELAGRIGISCQQLQKYEVATNRVSVGRLIDIADALKVDVAALLRDTATNMEVAGKDLGHADFVRLMRSFYTIRSEADRHKIIEMAEFFAKIEVLP